MLLEERVLLAAGVLLVQGVLPEQSVLLPGTVLLAEGVLLVEASVVCRRSAASWEGVLFPRIAVLFATHHYHLAGMSGQMLHLRCHCQWMLECLALTLAWSPVGQQGSPTGTFSIVDVGARTTSNCATPPDLR